MSRARAIVAALGALGALAALTGCGRAPAEPELFPLEPGWRWTYRVTTRTDAGSTVETLTVTTRGLSRYADGAKAFERRNSWGNHYWFRADAAGIYRVARRNEIDDEPEVDPDLPRRFVLREPIRVGTHWQAPTLPFLLQRRFDWPYELKYGQPVSMQYQIEAIDEALETPAGRFERCVRVAGQHTLRLYADPASGYADVPIVHREWFCPGVGLARIERHETVSRSRYYSGGSMEFELTEVSR